MSTEPRAQLTLFQAQLYAALDNVGLIDHTGPQKFQFDATDVTLHFAVEHGRWVLAYVVITGPRRLADGTNSTSTRGMTTLRPSKDHFPSWLTNLVAKAGPHQFPQGY